MRILRKEPGKSLEIVDVTNDLKMLQQLVGGYIECVYPFEAKIGLVVNEEGKLEELPPNFGLLSDAKVYDIVAGTALFVGLSEENFCSLSTENIESIQHLFGESHYGVIVGTSILPAIEVTKL